MKTFRLILFTLLLTAIPIKGFSYTDDQIVDLGNCWFKVVSGQKLTLAYIGVKSSGDGNLDLTKPIIDSNGYKLTVVGAEYNPLYRSHGIVTVKLPETMQYIAGYSFSGSKLTAMNIPKGLKRIAHSAWSSVSSVPKFKVDPLNANYESTTDGTLYSRGRDTLLAVPSNVALINGKYTVNADVKVITTAAFQSVVSLKVISLPKNLQRVYEGYPTIAPTNTLVAFEIDSKAPNFKVIDGVLFRDNTLVVYPRAKPNKNYTVPAGITTITNYAISNSPHLESINLNGVTTMLKSSIYNAGKLAIITLPKDVKPYDKYTKTGMVEGCFEACPSVTEFKVHPDNKAFVAKDGVLFSQDEKILYFYPANKPGTTYNIPSKVETIAGHAFQSARNITSMHIPANVKDINPEAFRDVEKLTNLTFDESSTLQYIGYYAFRWCYRLKEVTLPKSLPELDEIFYMCTNLEKINIPAGSKLMNIWAKAFSTNTKLKEFNFLGDCNLVRIEKNVFAGLRELQSFKIPKSVKFIESNAFIGCANMKTVTFDPNAEIEEIGAGAFADCGITSINIPAKVKKIDREAFLKCAALNTINITKTTTSISPEAFKYCSNLTAINVDKDNNVYSSIDGYLLSKSKGTLMIFPPGKANDKFTLLPPSITTIGDYAFYDCKKLENVTIPNKVDSIGIRAFGLCENLNTITFLCDQMIDPKHINQRENETSFDDNKGLTMKMGKIRINVRQDKLGTYQADPFYQKFHSISPSFNENTEEYIKVSDKAVDLLSTACTDHTFILPQSIVHDGKTYEVSLIGDYAFENAPSSMKEVVVKRNVKYIGAKAFVTVGKKIESVFFIESQPTKGMLSTTRFELDATEANYNEFAPNTKIYVKKSAFDRYKKEWTKMVYNTTTKKDKLSPFNFTSQIDYKIKDAQIETKYVTFAREFDVDFSDCALNEGVNVAAFVSGQIKSGTGDHGGPTPYHVRMKSIDLNGGVSDSYGYIPANTGVLLKILSPKSSTENKLYYTIGEKDNVAYNISNNIMTGVTVNSKPVNASESSPVYVLQGGIFRKATTTIPNFPVHKAYMLLPPGAPAKLSLSFGDDDETTDIENITTDEETKDNDVYYNLNGQRVSNPQKGVYIHNGKKVIIK